MHSAPRACRWRDGPILPGSLLLPCGIGHDTGWSGSPSDSSRHHTRQRRNVDRERSLLAWPWGFAVRPSLEDLQAHLGRVTRIFAT